MPENKPCGIGMIQSSVPFTGNGAVPIGIDEMNGCD